MTDGDREDVETIDALPVLDEPRVLEPPAADRPGAALVASPAAAALVAVSGFVLGTLAAALLGRLRSRALVSRPARGRLGRRRREALTVAATRSFLVDVHLLSRR